MGVCHETCPTPTVFIPELSPTPGEGVATGTRAQPLLKHITTRKPGLLPFLKEHLYSLKQTVLPNFNGVQMQECGDSNSPEHMTVQGPPGGLSGEPGPADGSGGLCGEATGTIPVYPPRDRTPRTTAGEGRGTDAAWITKAHHQALCSLLSGSGTWCLPHLE